MCVNYYAKVTLLFQTTKLYYVFFQLFLYLIFLTLFIWCIRKIVVLLWCEIIHKHLYIQYTYIKK